MLIKSGSGMARFLGLLVATLIFSACTSGRITNTDITSVMISGKMCEDCFDVVTLRRGGAIQSSTGALFTSDPKFVSDAFKQLPLGTLHTFAHKLDIIGPTNVVSLIVGYANGAYENVAVPVNGGTSEPELAALGRQVESVADSARYLLLRDRGHAIERALRENSLRSIQLEMTACMGTCPAYTVIFSSDGTAKIRDRGPGCDTSARASVPFHRVRDAAGAGAWLLPYYPRKWTDTPGASITYAAARFQYVSYAPDEMEWTSRFRGVASRLDQIVRDTQWTPPIDLARCARLSPIRTRK
jgi:hypothetical protein